MSTSNGSYLVATRSLRRSGYLQMLEAIGAGEWARTIDLLITNQLLYQLSYAGQAGCRRVERGRISG